MAEQFPAYPQPANSRPADADQGEAGSGGTTEAGEKLESATRRARRDGGVSVAALTAGLAS